MILLFSRQTGVIGWQADIPREDTIWTACFLILQALCIKMKEEVVPITT